MVHTSSFCKMGRNSLQHPAGTKKDPISVNFIWTDSRLSGLIVIMGIEIANDAEFQWKNRKNMKNLIDTRKNIVYNKNKRRRHRYGKGTIAENRSSLCVVPELERNGREYDHPASAGRWVSGGNERKRNLLPENRTDAGNVCMFQIWAEILRDGWRIGGDCLINNSFTYNR